MSFFSEMGEIRELALHRWGVRRFWKGSRIWIGGGRLQAKCKRKEWPIQGCRSGNGLSHWAELGYDLEECQCESSELDNVLQGEFLSRSFGSGSFRTIGFWFHIYLKADILKHLFLWIRITGSLQEVFLKRSTALLGKNYQMGLWVFHLPQD